MDINTTNDTIPDDLSNWFLARPKWLQTAASRLAIKRKIPNDDDIRELTDLCVLEANDTPGLLFESLPTGILSQESNTDKFKLIKIDKVIGVNAIQNNACIDFEDADIAVVFGMNGSGKSGYTRLLKHVCGARHKSELLSNVFDSNISPPSCEVTITTKFNSKTFTWIGESNGIRELRSTHVFDTAAAEAYIESNNEASYEPRKMRFLSSLIVICDRVSAEILNRKNQLQKKLPSIPFEYTGTDSANFLLKINSDTKTSTIEIACKWSDQDSDQRQQVEKSLKEHDITTRLNQVEQDKRRLSLFKDTYEAIKLAVSDKELTKVFIAKADAIAKRKVASEDASRVFSNSSLNGVGEDSWRLMWEEARKYSERTAYQNRFFPVTDEGDLCVLCHQPLDDLARKRMSTFEVFVKSGLEVSATDAENIYSNAIQRLPVMPDLSTWDLNMDFLKIPKTSSNFLLNSLKMRLEAIPTSDDEKNLCQVDWSKIDTAIFSRSQELKQESAALEDLKKDGKKAELEKILKELRAREWISQQETTIFDEVSRLIKIKSFEQAEKITKTNGLTSKKNDLARLELSTGYKERFHFELKKLGGSRLKVEPIIISEGKGKISFKLAIKEALVQTATNSVLSEGENRIVALAAFLADITGSGQPTPFVFDDPVSSLDQEFEELVVERLVELAKTRQVIVFTHRLSLLVLVEEAIKAKKRISTTNDFLPALSILTLRRVGNYSGRVDGLDVRHDKPIKGFTFLLDHKLTKIDKLLMNDDIEAYESELKAICGDFRILIERSIEKVMLNGVMERFRRSIQTTQIMSLAKINSTDCALIDTMMTKYSKFEHSQSNELAGMLPSSSELKTDLENVITWIKEFEKRTI